MVLTEHTIASVFWVPDSVDACQIYHALRNAPTPIEVTYCRHIVAHSLTAQLYCFGFRSSDPQQMLQDLEAPVATSSVHAFAE